MMTQRLHLDHALDEHGRVMLSVDYQPVTGGSPGELAVRVAVPPMSTANDATNPLLLKRLIDHLRLRCDGDTEIAWRMDDAYHASAKLAIHSEAHAPQRLNVYLAPSPTPLTELDLRHPEQGFSKNLPPLSTSECREIGESAGFLPYPRYQGMRSGGIITTDFHTHNSGELPGIDMLETAREQGVPYPTRLLRLIGVPVDRFAKTSVERVAFPPLAAQEKGLPNPEEAISLTDLKNFEGGQYFQSLARAMDVRWDQRVCFDDVERKLYRFRYPVNKIGTLVVPQLLKIGENYRNTGIGYAELNTVGLDKPEMFDATTRAVDLVREKYGVEERFLVGVPRTYDKGQLDALFARIKVIAPSPIVAGLDIVGYETNTTSHLIEHLRDLADWLHERKDSEFTFRVHAGENEKNTDNVKDVMKFAKEKHVRVRIGHALYGLDEETLDLAADLAKEGLVTFEFNMPSNIALNNIESMQEVPFQQCMRRGIPFVVSKDGSGIMNATSHELALQLHAAGFTERDYDLLMKTQKDLVARQLEYSKKKEDRLVAAQPLQHKTRQEVLDEYRENTAQRLRIMPPVPPPTPTDLTTNPAVLQEGKLTWMSEKRPATAKVPIVLVGASGRSWKKISEAQGLEAAIAIDMLVHSLDSRKAYFVHGRVKTEGVVGLLNASLRTLPNRFQTHALMTEEARSQAFHDRQDVASHITSIGLIQGTRMDIAEALMSEARDKQGVIVGIGGVAFSKDTYLKAHHENVPLYLLSNVEGASQQKARQWPETAMPDAKRLVQALSETHRGLFTPPLTPETIDTLYEQSRQRVEDARRPSSDKKANTGESPGVPGKLGFRR